jgi:hypothetical protein
MLIQPSSDESTMHRWVGLGGGETRVEQGLELW